MYFKFYIFTSENSWGTCHLQSEVSENSLEIVWISQVISRGKWQAIRQMSVRNKWNPVGLPKMFIWIFACENADMVYMECHLFFTCARGHVPRDSQNDFFLELQGTYRLTQKKVCQAHFNAYKPPKNFKKS